MDKFTQTSIKIIKKAMEKNRLVIWIGAGVSANSGYPSWQYLVKEFADDLGINSNDNSIETLLRIPQIYYYERGHKEYYDKITEIFNKGTYLPNPIHNVLFKLNPMHIITTNFDSLIEDTAEKDRLFYSVVKGDSELPYCSNNRMIIKMHGDIERKNIVLKEEDYLRYSNNFPLIETFVKSLFATHLNLFIGYSAQDPDFKLMFQWVKDVLGESFQPAYLIDVEAKNDQYYTQYLKRRGINVLQYCKEIDDEIDSDGDIDDDRGKKLYKFLEYLTLSHSRELSDIDNIYQRLKVFEGFNSIMTLDLIRVLDIEGKCNILGDNSLNLYSRCDIALLNCLELIREGRKDVCNNYELQFISDSIEKSGICSIHYEFKNEKRSIEFEKKKLEDDKYLKYILDFRITWINQEMKLFDLDKDIKKDKFKDIKKAYYLYKIGKFYESYMVLTDISFKAYKDKEYFMYFISEFNRIQVGMEVRKCRYYVGSLMGKTIKDIENDIRKIDLYEDFLMLPKSYRENLVFLRDILNFNNVYRNKIQSLKIVSQSEEDTEKVKNNQILMGYSSAISSYYYIKNLWEFITLNSLCIDYNEELRSTFLDLITILIEEHNMDNYDNSRYSQKIDFKQVDNFIFYIIIVYLKREELETILFNKKGKMIQLTDSQRKYVITSFKSMAYSMEDDFIPNLSYEYISNFTLLLSKIELEKSEIEDIIKFYTERIEYHKLSLNLMLEYIYIFIREHMPVFTNKHMNGLNWLLDEIFKKILTDESNLYNLEELTKKIGEIISLGKKHKILFEISYIGWFNNLINACINKAKSGYSDKDVYIIINILLPSFALSNVNDKKLIRELVLNIVKHDGYYSRYKYFELYIQEKVFNYQEDKDIFIKYLKEFLDLKNKNSREEENIDNIIFEVCKLIISKEIDIHPINNVLTELSKHYDIIKFILNIKEFDYNKFNLEWLKIFSDDFNDKILREGILKNKIKELYLKKLLDDSNKNECERVLAKFYL